MPLGLWLVLGLILCALGLHFLLADSGYVLITIGDYAVEMSVPVLFIGIVAVYLLIRVTAGVLRVPSSLGRAVAARQRRTAAERLALGFTHLADGDWSRGEKLLTRGIERSSTPVINFLMAARAAQAQGAIERRNQWLQQAFEALPGSAVSILLTQAELQLDNGEREAGMASLQRARELDPENPRVTGLLARTAAAAGDAELLQELLPQLPAAGLPLAEKSHVLVQALEAGFAANAADRKALNRVWAQVARPLRNAPAVLAWRARALSRIGDGTAAEKELRKALARQWIPVLIRAYGEIRTGAPDRQLQQIERWLEQYPDDCDLLVSAARVCLASELWGKARSYVESSIALQPTAAAFSLYANLLSRLGESEAAGDAYRRGLELVTGIDSGLPALAAPREDRALISTPVN